MFERNVGIRPYFVIGNGLQIVGSRGHSIGIDAPLQGMRLLPVS